MEGRRKAPVKWEKAPPLLRHIQICQIIVDHWRSSASLLCVIVSLKNCILFIFWVGAGGVYCCLLSPFDGFDVRCDMCDLEV